MIEVLPSGNVEPTSITNGGALEQGMAAVMKASWQPSLQAFSILAIAARPVARIK